MDYSGTVASLPSRPEAGAPAKQAGQAPLPPFYDWKEGPYRDPGRSLFKKGYPEASFLKAPSLRGVITRSSPVGGSEKVDPIG